MPEQKMHRIKKEKEINKLKTRTHTHANYIHIDKCGY